MKTSHDLRRLLKSIHSRGYKAYKQIKGSYQFEDYILIFDTIQGDPFAHASRIRVRVPQKKAGFPEDTYKNPSRRKALEDFLNREFFRLSRSYTRVRGTGSSGLISIDQPTQEVLKRSSVVVDEEAVEIRATAGLPAKGRRIDATVAEQMFFSELPRIVSAALIYKNLDSSALYRHIETVEDADYLRGLLDKLGLIAFVADGSVLPRASGVDQRPLKDAVVFQSPPELEVEVRLPNRGPLKGMGVPEGVTLIVGGGFHGKSTLLDAIKLGIYDHIPGDGREFVVSRPETVMIRAEDGRRVESVDISPFIKDLPYGKSTREFCTENASGSTSQAANIMEALEIGARVLLVDEDTSATNFMIRDHRMQELISKKDEPITPFIDKVRLLYRDYGVSSIIVIGGSGEYFDVADRVICMKAYRAENCTERAKEIARRYQKERRSEGGEHFGRLPARVPLSESLDPRKGKKAVKVAAKTLHTIAFGRELIDLSAIEQLVSVSQTRAIGDAMVYAMRYMDGKHCLKEVICSVMKDIEEKGLDVLSDIPKGDYAEFRAFELAGAINRLRSFRVKSSSE
ncbi:MAG: ABC-ATPase domain-containing protein [Nitrospirae bacterium]|nr:ABC-ATPase domain-containing protein [Nitrospirota bacterium]